MSEKPFENIGCPKGCGRILRPGLTSALRHKESIQNLYPNVEYHLFHDGTVGPNLYDIFNYTILGYRRDPDGFQPQLLQGKHAELYREECAYRESNFSEDERSGRVPPVNVISIIDFDGVVVSPIHSIVGGPTKITLDDMRWLRTVARLSDKCFVWTSRFQMSEGPYTERFPVRQALGLFRSGISYFPWMDQRSIDRLEKNIGENRLKVMTGKMCSDPAETMADIVRTRSTRDYPTRDQNAEQDVFDLYKPQTVVIYVGSSEKDRRVIGKYCERYAKDEKNFPDLLVFFDTGHIIL